MKLKPNIMNWSEPSEGKKGVSNYDHVISETPLGTMIIEWESWKDSSGYTLMIDDDVYIGVEYSLDEAKELALTHLNNLFTSLKEYLNK